MCHGKNCKYGGVTTRFTLIPRRMVALYNTNTHNISEFLLHEFCHEDVFNIKKAAFFIDNPDFDMVQGIAGFSQPESYKNTSAPHWDQPRDFSEHMKKATFNNKVKSFCRCKSIKRNQDSYGTFLQEHAQDLNFVNPRICTWDLKHYNQGILMFELDHEPDESFQDHFENMLYMLSFCPVV